MINIARESFNCCVTLMWSLAEEFSTSYKRTDQTRPIETMRTQRRFAGEWPNRPQTFTDEIGITNMRVRSSTPVRLSKNCPRESCVEWKRWVSFNPIVDGEGSWCWCRHWVLHNHVFFKYILFLPLKLVKCCIYKWFCNIKVAMYAQASIPCMFVPHNRRSTDVTDCSTLASSEQRLTAFAETLCN